MSSCRQWLETIYEPGSREKNKSEILAEGVAERIEAHAYLHGLAEIAAYLGCSISTVRRLIKQGLPVMRLAKGPMAKYTALVSALDHYFILKYASDLIENDLVTHDL